MKDEIRSFICIEVKDPEAKEILEEIEKTKHQLKLSKAKIKMVERNNVHLTLKFLGNVSEKMIDVIEENILNKIQQKSFELEIKNIGVFPSLKSPKVIWIGTSIGSEEVIKISKFLETNLSQLGFKREKKFSSHITIGRIKGGEHIGHLVSIIKNIKAKDITYGKIKVDKILIKRSELTPKGPIYSVLKTKVLDEE
ncbi:MAG: RNA 2',3'-cyclic phosphodiesterase [Candidatus Lokiarchaeota archaeon]|nr:RNA 2',3'-cyclic phosphodiesterase [Candidatus Lokiarchaeota archaeon]